MRLMLASALVSVAVVTSAAAQSKQDFTLVNRTGYDISEVYISPSKADDWQEDVLGDDELGDGVQTRIRFKRAGNTCRWDLKVVYSVDDSSAVWSNVDLCKISKITIKYNRKNDQTSALFD
ncbi:MAG: hypothetical protein O9972_48170 [Burkholderiales bacterium]|jgi:hypothetical protein|nr:hypothetical protein [Burkholderiales bacterium]